jgi:hypothetical protein
MILQDRPAVAAFLLSACVVLGGCKQEWNIHKAPEGFSIVREHVISAPRNIPPIQSELDFTIIEIDGAPVRRENLPPLVDIQPGALITAGAHCFRAKVAPHLLPPNYRPYEVSFVATVERGKIYLLVDKNGGLVLVEEHLESQ